MFIYKKGKRLYKEITYIYIYIYKKGKRLYKGLKQRGKKIRG